MTTIKSYSSIEQSRKLAEILPTETADMFCADVFDKEKETHSYNFHILSTWGCNIFEELKDRENKFVHFIPCWSLAALLNVLPDEVEDNHYLTLDKEGEEYCCCYEDCNGNSFKHCFSDNLVDACVAMIENLHELKKL